MSAYTHCYCFVRGSTGVVVAIQGDDGNPSSLIGTLEEFEEETDDIHVVRDPVERARHLLMEVHPEFQQ